ncbi:hypothetical protein SAMN04489761_3042 [Tenacibaculum sp. MAR_2009_124]|nr:hypothetical protein [Tenacibaculum sp. MAR_2009_124]SEC45592.1 hypothetical protein SAMN04489761_3042 [Tenacibaculum sp. MAR_2009_124]
MKGALGFLCIAAVIYVFWVTLEYFSRKDKQNNINTNNNKENNEKHQ